MPAELTEITPEMSVRKKEEALGHLVRDKLTSAPSFGSLLKASRSFAKSIYGNADDNHDELARNKPWKLLNRHSFVSNAKSARAATLKSLADAVIREANIPMMRNGKFRGNGYEIDWDKLA